jgi:hypothetical protein
MFDAVDAERVLDGEHVVAAWMAESGEVALGLTQYEFGESDGPGFGGCPAGPDSQPPTPPTSAEVTRAAGDVTLAWTTPTQPADANAVTQYRVAAVDSITGQEIAVRQGANTTGSNSATIKGLAADQNYRLILEANNGLWSPIVELGTVNADGSVTPWVDPNPAGGGSGGDGGGGTPTDPPAGDVAPTSPTLTRVLAGSQSITAEWTAALPGNTGSPVTGYELTATPTTGDAVTVPVAAGTNTGTIPGLTNGTAYTVSVQALGGGKSTAGTAATGVVATVTPGDVITVSRAQYRSDKREYRIQGTATSTRVHVRVGDVVGQGTTIQLNVPVAADGTWSVDVRNGPVLPTSSTRINITTDGNAASLVAPLTRSR